MNRKQQNILYFIGLFISAAILVSVTHAATPVTSWQSNLWDRLRKDFSLNHATQQARVASHKKTFLKNPKMFNDVSERAKPYLYYIAQELRERNLPMEFILIPVIESAYNPMAVSHAGAAGIWQLMPATARSLGVKQRNGHDGRRDIIASTEAALDYLTYLGKEFKQDWHLVLAAYNAGPNAVKRAITRNRKAGKGVDFWSLTTLPNETRQYVPKILALANLLKEKPSNFALPNVPNQPQVNPVKVEKPRQLKDIANLAGVDVKKIQELNPSLKTQTTTQHTDELLLPVKEAATLATALNTTPEVREIIPAVAVADTTPTVVTPAVVTPAVVTSVTTTTVAPVVAPAVAPVIAQQVVAPAIIQPVVVEKVAAPVVTQPAVVEKTAVAAATKTTTAATTKPAVATKAAAPQPTKTTYKVRKGDSLNIIASKFKVTTKEIAAWNKLNMKKYLYPGQALVIYKKPVVA